MKLCYLAHFERGKEFREISNAMAKVKVYQAKGYSIVTDQEVTSRRWFTRKGVQAANLTILEHTEVEIEESQLERRRQWTRVDFKPEV